jgi:hypothetical protein
MVKMFGLESKIGDAYRRRINNLSRKPFFLLAVAGLALGSFGCESDSSLTQHKDKRDTPSFASWSDDKKQDVLLYSDTCQKTFFPDKDGDGYGNKSGNIFSCEKPEGYVDNYSDCNDNNLFIAPNVQEICDLKDNNCDGAIDESWACICIDNDFDGFSLYSVNDCPIGNDCDDENKYVHPNLEEACDGIDNNCDGSVDEGCGCDYGATKKCGFTDIGKCEYGTQTCTNGTWGPCLGEIKSMAEECDNLDNNCDGKTDENLTKVCSNICGEGVETCMNGSWLNCTAPTPLSETCNGKDDDCDGKVDDALEKYVGCGPNGDGQQKQVCNNDSWVNSGSCLGGGACKNGETLDQLCGSDTGECQKGTQYKTCSNGQWDSWGTCQGEVKSKNETCNNKDDDCDGTIDKSLTQTCSSACGSGIETCMSGVWKSCSAPQPSVEVCDDKDNDCDGSVDEISDCTACDAYKNYSFINGKCCTNGKTNGTSMCILDSFDIPKDIPLGLAWDSNEKVLWFMSVNVDDKTTATFYKVSPSNGNLNVLSSFNSDSMQVGAHGLALDKDYLYAYDILNYIFYYTKGGVMKGYFDLAPEGEYFGCMDSGSTGVSNGQGLEWDGQYFWISSTADAWNLGLADGKVCQITTSGQVIKSYDAPGMDYPNGLSFGKNSLWINSVVNNGLIFKPTIYVMSITFGVVLNEYSAPTLFPHGLACEGNDHLWYSNSSESKIYKLEITQ